MKAKFSEFSYGFAFTHGLLKDLPGVTAVPQFPSQVIEGRVGYDLNLKYRGLSVFFQFKLSDRLTRRPAKYWSYYRQPYFRFNITPLTRSRQHNTLKELANSHEDVYYAAPLFFTTAEFEQAFFENNVATRSIWANLRDLPCLTDNEDHHVTFTGSNDPSWHTEPWNMKGRILEGEFSGERNRDSIVERFERNELREIGRDYFLELRRKLRRVLNQSESAGLTTLDHPESTPDVLREIDSLLTTRFGLEMMVIHANQPYSV